VNLRDKVVGALVIIITVEVVARVAYALLSPLLAPLIVVVILASLVLWVIRGPHASR
jgi:hypothetical protein